MDRWLFAWRRLERRMWFRASLYALVGVAVALLAVVGAPWVPDAVADRLGGESVEEILTILASSLLVVATFSLGAMVTAYTAVSSTATPRAAVLVTGDEGTQKALATFVGAFLYAIVGVTAINANYYGAEGRAIIFIVSLGVVALVAFRLLAWIGRLSDLARVGHMIGLVEGCACDALSDRARRPRLGGVAGALEGGFEITAPDTGYVQNVDPDRLAETAEALDCRVQVTVMPGAFVLRGDILARLDQPGCEKKARRRFLSAFTIGHSRSFDQDPRYGLIVLAEIATRALSPGVNDPGTAIQVVGAGVRLLDGWARPAGQAADMPEPSARVLAPALDPDDLMTDIFEPIAFHGAGDPAVLIRLRKGLAALARASPELAPSAARVDGRLLARAEAALPSAQDFTAVANALN
ncbi:MAG: DUF2254 domain-containing protein [Brevundimonas sp.]|uniref:DUF2254 domain-containing protein n=1 Tax=Brevundimonas sp. TaxID=1871086 RepID=UPI00391AAEF7